MFNTCTNLHAHKETTSCIRITVKDTIIYCARGSTYMYSNWSPCGTIQKGKWLQINCLTLQ